jgi:hypothetical protein
MRTITVLAGNAPFFDEIDMIVTETDTLRKIVIEKDVRGHPVPQPVGNRFFSAYMVSLPKGKYEISFVDRSTGSPSWPRYAALIPEAAPKSCIDYVEDNDFVFTMPDSSRPSCDELIFNGNFDEGKDGWYAFHHGINLLETGGIDGSPALGSTKALNTGNNIAQAIDGSCLKAGEEYDLTFSFKVASGSGTYIPQVRIQSQSLDTSDPSKKRFNTVKTDVFRPASGIDPDGWTTISGVWVINEKVANADKHIFNVGGGNYKVIVDNVFIKRKLPSDVPSAEPSFAQSDLPSSGPSSSSSNAPTAVPSISPSEKTIASEEPTVSSTIASEAPTAATSTTTTLRRRLV